MSEGIEDKKTATSSNDIYNQFVDIIHQVKDENNMENDWTSSKLYTDGPTDPKGAGGTSLYNNPTFNTTDLVESEPEGMFDEDFNDIPPFDELPSVLYLTGDIDGNTLKKSFHLFQQKQLLKTFEEENKKRVTEQGGNKFSTDTRSKQPTKNKNLYQTFSQPDTYVQDTSETKTAQAAKVEKTEEAEPAKDVHQSGKQKSAMDVQHTQNKKPLKDHDNSNDPVNSEKVGSAKDPRDSENRDPAIKSVKNLINRKPKDMKNSGNMELKKDGKFSEKMEHSEDGKVEETIEPSKDLSKKDKTQAVNNLQESPIRESANDVTKSNTGTVKNHLDLDGLKSKRDTKDDHELRKSKEEQIEIEFIRRKRLEKLTTPADEHQPVKAQEPESYKPVPYKVDNRKIVGKEEENMRKKINHAQASNKGLPDNKLKGQIAATEAFNDEDDDGVNPYAMRLFLSNQKRKQGMKPNITQHGKEKLESKSFDEVSLTDDEFDDDLISDDFTDEDLDLYDDEHVISEDLPFTHKPTAMEKPSVIKTPIKSVDKSKTVSFPLKRNKNAPSQVFEDNYKASSNSTKKIAVQSSQFPQGVSEVTPSQLVSNKPKKHASDNKNLAQNKNTKIDEKKHTETKTEEQKQKTRSIPRMIKSKVLKLQMSNTAEKRAKAFRSMKEGQYQMGIQCNSCGKPDCNSLHLQKRKEMLRAAKEMGFEVRDVAPDGNCMFSAIVDQLQFYGGYKFDSKSLREAAVNWLIENPNSEDGTPIEQFMEEDWQTYLQRMLGEGQWGDHIVLRAIVQVLGHMIKVMKVDKGKGQWMTLEPTNCGSQKDMPTLMIGHVGEFHYVSLHPADPHDSARGPSDDIGKYQNREGEVSMDFTNLELEGTESIAVFQEGHIDSESQIPLLHLSYILKKIIPNNIIDHIAILTSEWEELYTKQTCQYEKTELVGECGNKVYLVLSFGPQLKSLIKVVAIQNHPLTVSAMDKGKYSADFILEESGVHPGYAKLKQKNSPLYLINETFGVLNHRKPPADDETKYEDGQCVCHFKFHYEYVQHCLSWPGSASSWVSRERCENWPPQQVIDSIVSAGCLLKPNHHKYSQQPTVEWELGFDLAEKILFREAVTADQKYCYILWRSLIIQTVDLITGPLQLEHLRTVFLYSCERVPVECWTSNPGACLLYMFDELLRHIKNKFLPNYFIETNNMVDHLTAEELSDVQEKIVSVRYQPMVFLFQFHEACNFLAQGRKVFQMIQEDIPQFLEHKSIKKSTLETLVPASILITREYLKAEYFDSGYYRLSQTFEERLSVGTCDDALPYHLFIQHVVNGLDQNTIVWFSAYAEIHLKNQLPNPIVVELYGDRELMKIGDIVSLECIEEFANTLVPRTMSYDIYNFCSDFSVFLRHNGRADKVISVLLFAHNKYKEYLEHSKQDDNMESDVSMVKIYSGLTCVHLEQYNEQGLKEFYPYMEKLVFGLNSFGAFMWLTDIYSKTGEKERLANLDNIMKKRPSLADQQSFMDIHLYKKAMEWGKHKTMLS